MSDNKWDEKLTEKFLTLYRKHECLWNPYSTNYKNCSAKNEAFEMVLREFNVPGIWITECLEQIEVIRERYKEEQTKVKRGLKTGNLYNSKVPWFNLMSEMLCEVIRDEEKFDKNSKFYSQISNRITEDKVKRNENDNGNYKPKREESSFEKSLVGSNRCESNDLYYPSVISKEDIENSGDLRKDYPESDESDCNRCDKCSPSRCSWEKVEEKKKANAVKKIRFVKCKETGVQIEPEIKSRNLTIDRSFRPSSVCGDDQRIGNNLNRETIKTTKELADGTQREREGIGKGKCVSTEEKGNEITGSCVHCSLERNEKIEMEENVATCECRLADSKKCRKSRMEDSSEFNRRVDELPASEILQLYHQNRINLETENDKLCGEAVDRRRNKSVASSCYGSCIERFSRDSVSKFASKSEEERYDVCSRFKIVIPGPASKDKNLEITGYEIRSMNPELRSYNYAERYNRDTEERKDFSDSYCVCSKKELSLPTKGFDGSVIKLDINCKHSKDEYTQFKESNDESKGENEAKVSKETQTERFWVNETMRSEDAGLNSSTIFVRDQKSNTDDPSLTNQATRDSASIFKNVGTSIGSKNDSKSIEKLSCCTERRENYTIKSSSIIPEEAERFNNTRMVLNVIVKILEGDETQDRITNQELQRTLDTILEKFNEKMTIGGLNSAVEISGNERSRKYTPLDSFFETTQYQNLPSKLQRNNRTANDIRNSQKSKATNDTPKLTNSKSQSPEVVFDNYRDEIPAEDETPMLLLPGDKSNAASERTAESKGVDEELRAPNVLRDESVIGEEIIISRSKSPDDVIKMPRFFSDPIFNETANEFEGEEPVASSSRKTIEEARPANQLAKDFLDIIKYTIMMDEILETSENNDTDRYNKLPNRSNG